MRWISGVFALLNAALLLYGIKQFIGLAEMREDLGVSVQQSMKGPALSHLTARWQRWAASCVVSLRFSVLQALRVLSPGHAVMSMLLASPNLPMRSCLSPVSREFAESRYRSD